MQHPYMDVWIDPLGDPLTTRPIQTCMEFTMGPYPTGQFRMTDDLDRQFGNGSVSTPTQTQSESLELLLTLVLSILGRIGAVDITVNRNITDAIFGQVTLCCA